jgi:hypothetical protein
MHILKKNKALMQVTGGFLQTILVGSGAGAIASGSAYYKDCKQEETCTLKDGAGHAATGAFLGAITGVSSIFSPIIGPLVNALIQPVVHHDIKTILFGEDISQSLNMKKI